MKVTDNKPKIMPEKDKLMSFFKIVAYIEIALIFQVAMSVGTGVKPLLVIPLAIAISSWSDEITSACTGMILGFLLDISCGKLPGFNAAILIVMCTITSLLFTHLLRRKFINFFVIDTIVCIIQGLLDYFFFYVMLNIEGAEIVLKNIIFKSIFKTVIASIFIYFVIALINKKLKPYQLKTVEEAMQYKHEK